MGRWLMVLVGGLVTTVVCAEEGVVDMDRVAELERRVEMLSREVERSRFGDVISEVGESVHGLAPGASKVYGARPGVTLGGYGEGLYQNRDDGSDEADFLRAILYVGYKYTDRWVFNSEIEVEHASTGEEGSVSVEFAYVDYLHSDALNFRAGLVLVPMGLVNELHEPNTFLAARRPEVESRIIPSTWRENGLGIFGELAEEVQYTAYLLNGLDGKDFSSAGLRGGRQKGSKAKADDLAGVVQVRVEPTTGLRIGGSVYYGDSGQDLDLDVTTRIVEGHVDWNWRGFQARVLATRADVDDVAALNRIRADREGVVPPDAEIASVGEELVGWYAEVGYDVLNRVDSGERSLTPFVRYEEYNTQQAIPDGFKRDASTDVRVVTTGINFKPLDEVVFKADYQFYDDEADARGDQFNLALGYVF